MACLYVKPLTMRRGGGGGSETNDTTLWVLNGNFYSKFKTKPFLSQWLNVLTTITPLTKFHSNKYHRNYAHLIYFVFVIFDLHKRKQIFKKAVITMCFFLTSHVGHFLLFYCKSIFAVVNIISCKCIWTVSPLIPTIVVLNLFYSPNKSLSLVMKSVFKHQVLQTFHPKYE